MKHLFGTMMQRIMFKLKISDQIKEYENKIFTSYYTIDCITHGTPINPYDICSN